MNNNNIEILTEDLWNSTVIWIIIIKIHVINHSESVEMFTLIFTKKKKKNQHQLQFRLIILDTNSHTLSLLGMN